VSAPADPRAHMRAAFAGLSRTAQAVLAYATLAGLHSARGIVPIAEIKVALGLTDEEWSSAETELYEAVAGWPVGLQQWDDGLGFEVALTAEVARFAVGAAGRPSSKDWARIRRETFAYHFEADPPHCLACGDQAPSLAVDHLHPVSRGGSNHFHNFMPLCVPCNSSKGTKTWAEWIPTYPRRRWK
jgi:hypothetical protein